VQPTAQRGKSKPRQQTDMTMQRAIEKVGGLPADHDVLRAAFNKEHDGNKEAAGRAWRRACEAMRLELVAGRVVGPAM
jgi:hypothetical protein